jgi:hypothetical protein
MQSLAPFQTTRICLGRIASRMSAHHWQILICLQLALASAFIALPSRALAQAYRYIDEAGNIHFAGRVDQIPEKYRVQVIPPAPTPFVSEREAKRMERAAEAGKPYLTNEQRRKQKEMEKERRRKEKEEAKKKRQEEKLALKEERKAATRRKKEKKQKGDDTPDIVLEIYVSSTCPDCRQLDKFLRQNKIKHIKLDIEQSEKAAQFYEKVGGGDIPMIRVGNKLMKGYNEKTLIKLLELNEVKVISLEGKSGKK